MAKTTIIFGVLLVLLGLGSYFGTGRTSLTALIPAGFGLILLIIVPLLLQEYQMLNCSIVILNLI